MFDAIVLETMRKEIESVIIITLGVKQIFILGLTKLVYKKKRKIKLKKITSKVPSTKKKK